MTKPLEQDLKAQIDTLVAKNNKLEAAIQEGISTLEALQAENEKFKEALDNISNGDLGLGESHPLARIARAALGEKL